MSGPVVKGRVNPKGRKHLFVMDSNRPYLSVVIPALNEEQRLESSLPRIVGYLSEHEGPLEVIVVDDGSTDRTSEVAEAKLGGVSHQVVRNEPNRGKGYSVKRGMLLGRGEYLLFSDADLSTPIEQVEKLLAALKGGADIAIGSRALAESCIELHQPWLRERLGKCFNVFVRMFIMGGIRDTQCGFKCFRHECVEPIFSRQTVERWGFDVELLLLARKLGYKVAEVPVHWIDSRETKVRTGFDGLGMVLDALRIKWRHRKLRPSPMVRHNRGLT